MNKKIRTIICTAIFAALTFVCAHAATSSAVMEEYYRIYYSNIYPNLNGANAIPEGEGYIDSVTGSLCTNTVDYTIKGKNGFDIPFQRVFKSGSTGDDVCGVEYTRAKTVPQYYYDEYTCSADNSTVTIMFENEKEMFEADTTFEGKMYGSSSKQRYESLKDSDTGIFYTRKNTGKAKIMTTQNSYVTVPTYTYDPNSFINIAGEMHIVKPGLFHYDYDADSSGIYPSMIFQDIHGDSYTFEIVYDRDGRDTSFRSATAVQMNYSKYKFSVVNSNDLSVTAQHPAGFTYDTTIKSDSGETYYFERTSYQNYNLLGISDRYGNTYQTSFSNGKYTVTTDDGVVYTCSSSGITKTYGDSVVQLVSYDTEVINSEKDVNNLYKIDNEYIFTVKKNSGTAAEILSDDNNVTKYFMRQELKYGHLLRNEQTLTYLQPYKIDFPTGLSRYAEYESANGWIIGAPGDFYDGEYYCVSRCYDKVGSTVKNDTNCSYGYTTNRYKPKYKYISYSKNTLVSGNDEIQNEITYITYPYRVTQKIIKDAGNNSYIQHNYTYSGSYSDSGITADCINKYIGGSSASHTKNYAYNAQNQLSRETDGDYECSYTYFDGDGETYLPKTTEYKKDADTTVKIENVLTEDKKSIAAQNTYENDVLKRTVNYTYDSFGNVASESVAVGDKTALTQCAYTYSPGGGYTVTKTQKNITDSEGYDVDDIVTTTVYDSEHRPISQTDGNGGVATMTYDMSGRLLSASYPDGTSESFSYDTVNNIVTCTAKNGTVYRVYFDEWNNRIKTTAVADGTEVVFDEYSYNDRGLVESYKRYTSAGVYNEAKYTYDGFGTITGEKVYDTDGTLLRNISYTQSISKDSSNRPVTTVKRSTSGGSGTFADYSESADYRGNITKREYSSGSDARTYSYTYDFVGNALTETDPLGNETSTAYDIFGNPTSVTYADGTSVSYEYNSLGLVTQKTDARGNTSRCEYDTAGRLINEYIPLDEGREMHNKLGYDSNGNVVAKTTDTGLSNAGTSYREITYAYDSMNRLSYSVEPTTNDNTLYNMFVYDSLGNITRTIKCENSLHNAANGQQREFVYDSLGRMVTEISPCRTATNYEYDYCGRVTKITDSAGIEDVYMYTAFDNIAMRTRDGESVTFVYDALGNRTQMTDSSGTTNYEYNPFGELTAETKNDILKSYTYDSLGRRTEFGVTNGADNVIFNTYGYDSVGRLTSVVNGQDYVEYTYDGNSNLLTASVNGVLKSSNAYNAGNLPITVSQYVSGELSDTTTYEYTTDGLLKKSNKAAVTGNNQVSRYRYDSAGRMEYEETTVIDSATDDYIYDCGRRIVYDSYGNPEKEVFTDDLEEMLYQTVSTFDADNKIKTKQVKQISTDYSNPIGVITTDTTYTYNTNGAITAITENGELKKSFEYDGFGRLSRTLVDGTESEYTYNGDNLRQTKSVDGALITHILDGANVVADISDSGTKIFVRGNSLELFKAQGGSTKTYLNSYPRNDVSALVDSDGSASDYIYTAYGEKIGTNDNTENPFGYCGEYFDTETGLVYLRNRYYDPTMHRFISEDPAKDGLNWYAYAGCNPTKYVDPWGLNSYVFVAVEMEKQAGVRKEHYEAMYNTECMIIVVSSAKEFVDEWNKLSETSKNGAVKVDAIEIISHGSATKSIGTYNDGSSKSTGYVYFGEDKNDKRLYAREVHNVKEGDYSISRLDFIEADQINVESCNSANPDIYNVVFGLMQVTQANLYTGFDGGSQWSESDGDHVRGGGEYGEGRRALLDKAYYVRRYQNTWWTHVPKKADGSPARNREGRRYFYMGK